MKKLTRKNLDALAAVMPVLSETEQQVCMGGVLYMNSGGTILGYDGGSYDILIAESLPTDYLTNPASSGNLSEQNDEIKRAVITNIAYAKGFFQGELEDARFSFMPFPDDENTFAAVERGEIEDETGSYSGAIRINTNSSLYQASENYFDFSLTLLHEKTHLTSTLPSKSVDIEYEAVVAMLNDTMAMTYCSNEYYTATRRLYDDLFQQMLENGKVTEDDYIGHIIGREPK